MSLDIRPLISTLRRSPAGALLVALQVSITLAVLVNSAWIVSQRIAQIQQPTGLDTRDTFVFSIASMSKELNIAQAESEDLGYLRSLPGVVAATATEGVPITNNGADLDLFLSPDERGRGVSANELSVDEQGLRTLDVPLVAGRNFRADEVQPLTPKSNTSSPPEIIVTQSLARALFPQGDALGKAVYMDGAKTIIGITRDFMGPQVGAPVYNAVLLPSMPGQYGTYNLLVRAQPGRRDTVLPEAEQHIGAAHQYGVIAGTRTLAYEHQQLEANNRNVAIFLTAVNAVMLAVCCLGVFGLTTFNVGSRTRQIGARRAVGARKRDVVTHFMVESALILAAGTLLGSLLALLIGDWLTAHYSLPRLDLKYLTVGVLVLWITGQLAAWQPARRAASVPPSVATRTV